MQLTGELKNLGYHIHTQESIKAIIELYEAWNKPEKAEE
jgi:hypothetical protein